MQHIAYKIFYDYEAMQKSSHLHNKLTEQEVKNNIDALPNELETMLSDKETTVSLGKSAKGEHLIFIKSDHSEKTINDQVIRALQGLSLFGTQQESTNEVVI